MNLTPIGACLILTGCTLTVSVRVDCHKSKPAKAQSAALSAANNSMDQETMVIAKQLKQIVHHGPWGGPRGTPVGGADWDRLIQDPAPAPPK